MVQTPSQMVTLGTSASNFKLIDVRDNQAKSLNELKSPIATVIMFICNHCPFVKHVQTGLVQLTNDYIPKTIAFVAINSNDTVAYPEDSPASMKREAELHNYPFPYLFDETQAVAHAYNAACTPDFFIYDKDLKLVYRGQMDDSRPTNGIPVTGKDLRNALDSLLAGETVNPHQKPSMGCNIKWKA